MWRKFPIPNYSQFQTHTWEQLGKLGNSWEQLWKVGNLSNYLNEKKFNFVTPRILEIGSFQRSLQSDEDNTNFGVYACLYMQRLMMGKQNLKFDKENSNANEFRLHIFDTISDNTGKLIYLLKYYFYWY